MKSVGRSILVLVLLATTIAHAEAQGNIAVAAEGTAVTANVSGKAARSPYFLLFDRAGKRLEAVENPHRDARRRAGSLVVHLLAQKGVTLIVAGEFGARMTQAMKAEGMEHVAFRGSVDAAVEKVLQAGR
jgi:predicted Fe-Mo cluster-binding NifX family protein